MSGWSKHISLLPHIPSGWSELWLIIAESGVVWTTEARRECLTHTQQRAGHLCPCCGSWSSEREQEYIGIGRRRKRERGTKGPYVAVQWVWGVYSRWGLRSMPWGTLTARRKPRLTLPAVTALAEWSPSGTLDMWINSKQVGKDGKCYILQFINCLVLPSLDTVNTFSGSALFI